MLKKCSLKVFCGCSYKTTWNSHTTPNYEKTFDAPNQRPYHFQTVKLLFLVKQKKKGWRPSGERLTTYVEIYLVCWWMSARMEHLIANELISINLVGVSAIALTKKKKKHDKINLAWLLLQLSEPVL